MSRIVQILSSVILILLSAGSLYAYWPTTVDENLPVAADSIINERACSAIPYKDGSVLVVYSKVSYGPYYQIIDRFGEGVFPEPQPVRPSVVGIPFNHVQLFADDSKGAYMVWAGIGGIFAQRIDSLGNRLWGDDAVQIFPINGPDFKVCLNIDGGFLLCVGIPENLTDWDDTYAQRIDSNGNLLWGPMGVVVSNEPDTEERHPVIAADMNGGCFIVWEDSRQGAALYAQHLNASGNCLWGDGEYIHDTTWDYQIISDSTGAFLMQAGSGVQNYNLRVLSNGNIDWEQVGISYWSYHDEIVAGEPGYFYMGFGEQGAIWGQRIDLDGNTYWPTNYGAPFANINQLYLDNDEDYYYRYPYFYSVFSYRDQAWERRFLFVNALDTLGNPLMGANGVLIDSNYTDHPRDYTRVVPTGDGGVVAVWQSVYSTGGGQHYDIWAKRANFDGTLGGALHLLTDMQPQNPPIQIPPGGGSFQFNLAIEDTYSVSGVFDAWIEATLPNGQDLEILHRDNITIQPNSVIQRPNMTQVVPANAPAGTYTYHLYVGNREYDDIWSEGNFGFVKIE